MKDSEVTTTTYIITTKDNIKLSSTLFIPCKPIKAGVIINSATAVKQGYYSNFATYLAQHGYLVVTYDYRGIGKSKINRKFDQTHTMQQWGELDLAAVIDWAMVHYRRINWHCIGHSVGGQIIGLANNNSNLASVYCVSSQSGYWKHWSKFHKIRLLLMWHLLIPIMVKLIGRIPSVFIGGENLPGGIAKQWAYWGRNKDYIVDNRRVPIREYFEQLQCNMSFIIIDDDEAFAPANAVKSLASFYSNANVSLETIDTKSISNKPIGHFGYFKQQYESTLWSGAVSWLKSQHTG